MPGASAILSSIFASTDLTSISSCGLPFDISTVFTGSTSGFEAVLKSADPSAGKLSFFNTDSFSGLSVKTFGVAWDEVGEMAESSSLVSKWCSWLVFTTEVPLAGDDSGGFFKLDIGLLLSKGFSGVTNDWLMVASSGGRCLVSRADSRLFSMTVLLGKPPTKSWKSYRKYFNPKQP